MAQIHNTELFKELREGGKLQPLTQNIPSELAEKVVPVMEVNPKMLWTVNKCISESYSDSVGATIYTCPQNKDTYFVGGLITVSKDANATSIYSRITIVPKTLGQAASILIVRYEPLTAMSNISMNRELKFPILLARGSAIIVTNSAANASIDISAEVQLIEVDNPNA